MPGQIHLILLHKGANDRFIVDIAVHYFSSSHVTAVCELPDNVPLFWIGDGWCDSNLNIPAWNYDGQDCCNPNSIFRRPFCTCCTVECECTGLEASPSDICPIVSPLG